MDQQGAIRQVLSTGENIFYLLMMLASAAVLVYGVTYLRHKTYSQTSNNMGSVFRVFMIYVLGATALVFVPVYYVKYTFDDSPKIVRPLLLSVHNAMRVFFLDGDFDFIRDGIRGLWGLLHLIYSVYAAAIYVFAPAVFSFTVFLSLFRDAFAWIQLHMHRNVNLYVFSCLNRESAAMALSITSPKDCNSQKIRDEEYDQTDRKTPIRNMIVFCNIPHDEKERKALIALLSDSHNKRAYVLLTGNTVEKINILRFRQEITFFLMDKSEARNIQDASALCRLLAEAGRKEREKPYRKRRPVPRILVYASTPASIPLIDALSKKASVPDRTVRQLTGIIRDICQVRRIKDIEEISQDELEAIRKRILSDVRADSRRAGSTEPFPISMPFSIMRVDIKTQIARRIILDFQATDTYCLAMNQASPVITVTLLGLGGIGKEILENLLWMCQRYNVKLFINVFDATGPQLGDHPDAAHNPLYDRLAYEWPELMKTNREWQQKPDRHPDTEANYDIRFFLGMDCFSNRFRLLFESDTCVRKRLLQTNLVICSLGDDDKNLEAAMMMRQLFVERAVENGQIENNRFYSTPDIFAIVYDNEQSDYISSQGQITNYKNQAYNIRTVGSMRTQYSFAGIKTLEGIEKAALVHHIYWTLIDKKKSTSRTSKLRDQLNNYVHYEYYRQSSLAKAMHKDMFRKRNIPPWDQALITGKNTRHSVSDESGCRCPLCQSRITEHMRWNAYMRVNGYRYGAYKNDMAKIHNDLKSWADLGPKERKKD